MTDTDANANGEPTPKMRDQAIMGITTIDALESYMALSPEERDAIDVSPIVSAMVAAWIGEE